MRLAETKCALKKAEFPFQFKALCQQKAYKFLHAIDGLLRWFFFQETHVFFFMIFVPPLHPQKSLCFPWTSCFNFLVMKCDEWLRNVVHPIYTKELPHWDGLCHPFLRNAERADGKLGWNHPSRTQMPRSVMMWIWIYHDLFIYLPNCLFMRWFIELFIYIYPIIYLSTYLPT